jgi:integrase
MATIKRRSDRGGRWQVRYRDPTGAQRARLFDRKVDAERFAATTTADMLRGTYIDVDAQRTTVADFVEQWASAQPWRPGTRDKVTSTLRTHIFPAFGHRPIGSLRTSELQTWAVGLERSLAPSTVEGTVRLLASILRAAVVDRLIPASPADGVRLRRREGTMAVPLTVAEVRALADAAPAPLAAAVVVCAATGLRQGELFGLTGDRVAWLRRELVVDRQLLTPQKGAPALGPCKTARSVRTVPLAVHALDSLAQHVERYGPGEGGLVFHRDGASWRRQRAAEAFNRLADAAGITAITATGWHALRHHTASVLIAQGLGVTAVAATLGHSPAECLSTYAGWWPNEHEQIRSAVGRAWGSSATVTARAVTP